MQYVTEAVNAIVESPFRSKDVSAVVQVRIMPHFLATVQQKIDFGSIDAGDNCNRRSARLCISDTRTLRRRWQPACREPCQGARPSDMPACLAAGPCCVCSRSCSLPAS